METPGKNFKRFMSFAPLPKDVEEGFEQSRVSNLSRRLKIFGALMFLYCAADVLLPNSQPAGGAAVPGIFFGVTVIHAALLAYKGGGDTPLSLRRAICLSFIYCLCAAEVFAIVLRSGHMPYPATYFTSVALLSVIPVFRPREFIPPAAALLVSALGAALSKGTDVYLTCSYVLQASVCFMICVFAADSFYVRDRRSYADSFALNKLNRDLTDKATHDELTKLYNRRAFEQRFHETLNACRRSGRVFCVIMLDVDCFKFYNDDYGHLEGDKALFKVAECMRYSFQRSTDFCARFGGEEFVVIAEMDGEDAVGAANTLLHRVSSMNLPNPRSAAAPYLTVSAGLVALIPGAEDTRESILTEADEALYNAKEAGRNRVVANIREVC